MASRLLHFFDYALQSLLELALVHRAGDERAHVERVDLLLLEVLGHVAAHDALRQAFDDGRLARAGFADQDGVVLGSSAQYLQHAAYLLVASDDGVELAFACPLAEVLCVLVERTFLLLVVVGLIGVHSWYVFIDLTKKE